VLQWNAMRAEFDMLWNVSGHVQNSRAKPEMVGLASEKSARTFDHL
jgi:hypothetical protein